MMLYEPGALEGKNIVCTDFKALGRYKTILVS